jgi:hypothetical protein
MTAAVRIDDLGDRNEFSFMAQGGMNLGSAWAIRSSLYLFKSFVNLYGIEVEYRGGDRFLCKAVLGSFDPMSYNGVLDRSPDLISPVAERRVTFFTRITFGGL